MEIRCHSKLHGIAEGSTLEVSCQSRWCGKRKNVVVIHKFDLVTGQLISTKKFADPKGVLNGSAEYGGTVRAEGS